MQVGRSKAPGLPIKALSFCRPTDTAGGRWCRKSPRGGSHRRWLIDVMLFITYDTDSQSRNADFISIARRAIHNPRPKGPSNLRTFRTLGAKPRQPSPLNPHAAGVSKGRFAALLSYPHFVQNSVNSCRNSQEKSSELLILSTKLVTEIHNRVIHNL